MNLKTMIKKYYYLFFFLVVSLFANFFLLTHHGIPFRYDWNWPVFSPSIIWKFLSTADIGILNVLTKNTSLVFATLGSVVVDTELYLRIFLLLITFLSGYGAYLFISRQKVIEPVSIIFGIIYAMSPYVFIRTIVGFRWALIAYTLIPIFFHLYFNFRPKKIYHYIMLGFLLSLISAQIQALLLLSLILFVYLLTSLWQKKTIIPEIRTFLLTYFFFALFDLPWLIYSVSHNIFVGAVSGATATSIDFISKMPHSLRNFFMLSDHHITSTFFYSLSHDKIFMLGWLIVWFVAFCAVFNKPNRRLVLTLIISCLLVLPFIKGPLGIFGNFYIWFYSRVPYIAVFRETYHFELLCTIALCILFAFGLDWLWQTIGVIGSRIKRNSWIGPLKVGAKTLLAGSALFIIMPYFTLDFAGYLKLEEIPAEYDQLHDYLQSSKDICHKAYYPPGLGFIYFKGDDTTDASNSDVLAYSLGIPYLTDGTSVLDLPTDEMFYRNEVVSQFLEPGKDSGEFADLLKERDVDCVILRLDTDTKYYQVSNLWREKDLTIVKKWRNLDLKVLMELKTGFKLERQFGDNILVYRSDQQYQPSDTKRKTDIAHFVGETATEKFKNSRITQLLLTEWATGAAYYRDGWSRGRYDFWRKHLFTQLRQDFIYTDRAGSEIRGKVSQEGSCELWVRYLGGGSPGSFEIDVDNKKLVINKNSGEEKFVWRNLDRLDVSAGEVRIKNISGENAIADLVCQN